MKNKKTILVTGAAGFIGASLINRLLDDGNYVIGVDNINDYYDIKLKNARLSFILEKIQIVRVIGNFIKNQLMIMNL